MAEGCDLVAGAVLMDDLLFADGTRRPGVPGGAGLYALAGAALFGPDPVLIAGAGEDLPETFGPWMDRNGLSKRGLRLADRHGCRNLLTYDAAGGRTEAAVFGADHFALLEPRPADLAPFGEVARSLYVFRNDEPGFWTGLDAVGLRRDVVVLWEVALDACEPGRWPTIEAALRRVDALSLNLDEAERLLGATGEDAVLEGLGRLPVATVFLRVGARGSYALAAGRVVFVPSLPGRPVDVTGGGNAYGGGALVGLARGLSAEAAAAMGTAAARLAIDQHGPPEAGDPAVRARARRLAASLTAHSEGSAA